MRRNITLLVSVLILILIGEKTALLQTQSRLTEDRNTDISRPVAESADVLSRSKEATGREGHMEMAPGIDTALNSKNSSLSRSTVAEKNSLHEVLREARYRVMEIPVERRNRQENLGYDLYSMNPDQNLATRYGVLGTQFTSSSRSYTASDEKDAATSWSMNLRTVSFGGSSLEQDRMIEEEGTDSNKISYRLSNHLLEWFVNKPEGVEQGYTVLKRPDEEIDDGRLSLEIQVEGLLAHSTENADRIEFKNDEETVLSYSKLVAWDATGKALDASMSAHGNTVVLSYNDTGAVYPVQIDPLIINEQHKESRIFGAAGDGFGSAVAMSGDFALVGAWQDDDRGSNAGCAYVFERVESTWILAQKLTAEDGAAGDWFGSAVSVSGDTLVVGAQKDADQGLYTGSVYVFSRTNSKWTQQQKLTAEDQAEGDRFGKAVSVSGDSIVVGAPRDGDLGANSGSAYVFVRSDSNWSQQQKLTAGDGAGDDQFGTAVSLSGDTVVVGSRNDDDFGENSGSAYVFLRTGEMWSQEEKLSPSDGVSGGYFGFSVALEQNTLIVGAYNDDDNGNQSGAAYVYFRSGVTWNLQQKLTASDGAATNNFGYSVSVSGDVVMVGAFRTRGDNASEAGSAYMFTRSGSSWTEREKLTAADDSNADHFGISVVVSGDYGLAGVPGDDDLGSNSGSAYCFVRSGEVWIDPQKLTARDQSGDAFGIEVCLSGDTAMIAALDDDFGKEAGAVYVLERVNGSWLFVQKLTALDGSAFDYFGTSISISGDTAVIGAYGNDDSTIEPGDALFRQGSVYIFERDAERWCVQQIIRPEDATEIQLFGTSVSIVGDSVLVGARGDEENGDSSGSAYVFSRSGTTWLLEAKLVAPDAATGDRFGYDVVLSGETALISAPYDEVDGIERMGSAYVFVRSEGNWKLEQKIVADESEGGDFFGWSVALAGDMAVIGALNNDDGGEDSGCLYVFLRSESGWVLDEQIVANEPNEGEQLGKSLSLSGITIVSGATIDQSGGAYVFMRSESGWEEVERFTAADAGILDEFGSSVSASCDGVLIGAYWEDDNGPQSGSAYFYELRNSDSADLCVMDSSNVELKHGDSASYFDGIRIGASKTYLFTAKNKGTLGLDLSAITLGGADAGEFSISLSSSISGSPDLNSGESLLMELTHTPSGISGPRSATLSILSNDPKNSGMHVIHLSAIAFSPLADGDSDGMNDWAEYELRSSGFDWQRAQPNLTSDFYEKVSAAGLYTASEAGGISAEMRLIEIDPETNSGKIVIELSASSDLATFQKLNLLPLNVTINEDGALEYEVEALPGKKFFRAEFK